MRTRRLCPLIVALSLNGCALSSIFGPGNEEMPNTISSKNAEEQLAATAKSVSNSLITLAKAQDLRGKSALDTAPLITPEGGMGGTADIDWAGPIQPLLQQLADLTDYKLKVMGSEPPIPVMVNVNKQDVVIADIVKDVGLQAGRRAHVVVFPSTRIIELRYTQL